MCHGERARAGSAGLRAQPLVPLRIDRAAPHAAVLCSRLLDSIAATTPRTDAVHDMSTSTVTHWILHGGTQCTPRPRCAVNGCNKRYARSAQMRRRAAAHCSLLALVHRRGCADCGQPANRKPCVGSGLWATGAQALRVEGPSLHNHLSAMPSSTFPCDRAVTPATERRSANGDD